MEPPARARTSSNATSNHKRTTSKSIASLNGFDPKSASNGGTVISLFLRNCRLLNFDLLPDWPSITPASLGNNDARARIRCAEWSLYQLFKIYDPATALDKLQPFFPPLEPLQSINLRAALYRCLNDLKKNGVLGRETVLRKSMLDDCQGDKFWEVCLSFSAVVLRKVTKGNKNRLPYEKPTAEAIGTAKKLSKTQRESMLPLAIAHKAALTRVLVKKERTRQAYSRLYDVLLDKESDLEARKLQAQEQERGKPKAIGLAQVVLDRRWVGSDELRNALVNGDEVVGTDNILTKSFDSVWRSNERGQLFKRNAAEVGILEDLENRTRHQKRRLQKWQSFHEKLLSSMPQPNKGSDAAAKAFQFRFDKHQNMTMRDVVDNPLPPSPARHNRHASTTKYDEILTAMREELRKKSATDPGSPTNPVDRVRRPSVKRQSMSVDAMMRASPEPHQRSMSQTAVPVRPRFGQRVSSRSRSYQAPKVVGQREPIPLKSEIFSPLKTERTNSASPSSRRGSSMLASPLEDPSLEASLDAAVGGASNRSRQGSGDSNALAGLGISHSATHSRNTSDRSNISAWRRSGSENPDSAVELPSKEPPANRNTEIGGRKVRGTLADRTRMSMAHGSTDSLQAAAIPDLQPPRSASPEMPQASPVLSDTTITNDDNMVPLPERRPTLEERTQQSISLAPQPAPEKISHTRSHTSQFPANKWNTPEKRPRSSTVNLDVEDDRHPYRRERSITPRDKLFEEDAEYSSIFKARPKLARSPDMTPVRDSGHGSMDSEVEVSFADDEVAMSSPLMGR